jgi:hypothetical protein
VPASGHAARIFLLKLLRIVGGASLLASSLSLASPALSAIALTDATYTQNFDTLAASGTSSALPDGWQIAESGTNANSNYTANNGSSTTGDTYSYGTGTNPDRALGSLGSGSLA